MNLPFEFSAEEIIEQGRCELKDIKQVKIWLENNGFPEATNEQIVLFLLSCEGNVEYTKATMKAYYYYMYHGKNITNCRDIHSEEMKQQAAVVESIALPKRTKDNYMVVLQRLKDFSYWNFNLETSIKFLLMTVDLGLMKKPPPSGLITVFDMTGVSLMHLTRLRVGPLRIFIHLLQEALPCRMKAIHILNATYFADKVKAILRPLMKKELYEMIHFHQPNMDMEAFFEKHVEADCIPSDYGGNLPTFTSLSEATLENMKEKSDWFVIEERLRKDYSPRA